MTDDAAKSSKAGKKNKEKDGDDAMTVVVPPSKSEGATNGTGKEPDGDIAMNAVSDLGDQTAEVAMDPEVKAISGKLFVLKDSR